jgi:hypothetical protein
MADSQFSLSFEDSDQEEFMFDDDNDDNDDDDASQEGTMDDDPETEMMNVYYQSKGDMSDDSMSLQCLQGFKRVITLAEQLQSPVYVLPIISHRVCVSMYQYITVY